MIQPLDSRLLSALIEAAVGGRPPAAILEALCQAMVEAGLPLARATVGALLVHPLLDATLVVWRRDGGAHLDDTPRPQVRGARPGATARSTGSSWPGKRCGATGSPMARAPASSRCWRSSRPRVSPTISSCARTWHPACRSARAPASSLPGPVAGRAGFATTRSSGSRGVEPVLAVVIAAALGTATAATLLATYLGADAARRVLGGDIERGRAEMIHAVIWYSDLAGFTRLTDRIARAGMLQMFAGHAEILRLLNDHAEILVDAIEGRGGQVLKFMGDGLLAIFRAAAEADACEAALDAWTEASARCAALSRRPIGDTHPYLALHAGDVLYGNIGGRARLDFTVLGSAVNETSRIAALCRQLDQPVILSETFAELCPPHRRPSLVGLGRYALRGVAQPQMLFGLEAQVDERSPPGG